MSFSGGAAGAAEDTRTSTIVVAASNSLDPTLAPSAYRCSGVNDEVEMNAALVAAAAVNGSVELLEGDYNTVLTLSVAVNVTLKAVGWGSVINFNAAGNAVTIAGDNVKLRDFKVVIVAGAGGAGTRPNCIYATARTNVEITKLWLYGDQTEVDDGSNERQVGILFGINMAYTKIAFCTIHNFERHGIGFVGTSGNEIIHVEVEGNICYSNLIDGIRLEYTLYSTITGNTCQGNNNGIRTSESLSNTFTGNTCQDNTEFGIRLLSASNQNTVSGSTLQGNGKSGFGLGTASLHNTITGNTCQGNTENGISLTADSDNATITGNTCRNNTEDGIELTACDNCTVTGNTCSGNTLAGIDSTGSDGCTFSGNTCQNNTENGIHVTGTDNTVSGNTCQDNTLNGIEVIGSYNTFTGNTCYNNVRHGIFLDRSNYNLVVGNNCNYNDSGNTNTYDGICIEDDAYSNLVMCNICNYNDRWGISIGIAADNCVENWVKNNTLFGNNSGPFFDGGIDTRLATKTFQFQQGGDASGIVIANFISADGSAKGWEIDGADEWAIVLGQIPLECQMVVRIKIWAVNLAAAGGVGVEMWINIIANAGGSDEPYTTEAIVVNDKPSVEDNLPANDVIHWMIDATDDTDIDEIQGGDSFELKVNFDPGENGDLPTDAVFRAVEIEYV